MRTRFPRKSQTQKRSSGGRESKFDCGRREGGKQETEKQKERYKKLDALRDPHKRGPTSPDKLLANHHLVLVGGGLGIALDNLAQSDSNVKPNVTLCKRV